MMGGRIKPQVGWSEGEAQEKEGGSQVRLARRGDRGRYRKAAPGDRSCIGEGSLTTGSQMVQWLRKEADAGGLEGSRDTESVYCKFHGGFEK